VRVTTLPPRRRAGLLKRVLVGRAMATARLEHTLLPKVLALPVFSSDALSSVAYATEEILLVLSSATAAASARRYVMPIALAIAVLMVVVISSYRQTVRAYPSGGGAYIVSKENLGTLPGLVAAAALLTDYVLTVAVSVAAGVFAITSARPALLPHRVELALGFVAFITLANLRGVRESGTLFAIPTYAFIASILGMVAVGLARCATACPSASPVPPHPDLAATAGPVGAFTILRAFSSGSTALTGVEAISNGVPAFRRPQAKNAADTLAMMGAIAIAMFLGISFLATHVPGITVSEERSVVAQIADAVFGGGIGFYLVQAFTAAILVLAANTAYQDFPRLSAILARDRFMPRQFMNRGDRLVFSNGVLTLATLAGLLLVAFDAEVSRLIQLYVVGVFASFTLSQLGMVRHWLRERERGEAAARGWRRAMAINAVGGLTTGVVLVVITATKFLHGAWIVIAAIPVIVSGFLAVHRHYASVREQLRRGAVRPGEVGTNHVVLLVRDVDAATAEALGYVRSFRPRDLRAVTPIREEATLEDLRARWRTLSGGAGPELEPLPAGPDVLGAVRAFLEEIPSGPRDFVTVVIPELVGESLALYLLRRRALVRLKAGLLREAGVVVTDVPVLVERGRPVGVDARPLIPTRTVALVFVSAVHDATIRAVNYARTLGAQETRAVHFSLDPDEAGVVEEEWERADPGIPLDVVEAPFRDLTGPILHEVRRVTATPEAVCAVVLPEFVVARWRHVLLHNQNALFVKRLLLTEPRVILSSVPYPLEEERWIVRRRSPS
jgi:amino acid transporter